MKPVYAYIWEFMVPPDSIARFQSLYGPEGDWVSLFRRSNGYIRTVLLRDTDRPERFITVDFWASRDEWVRFRDEFAAQFEELDRLGEDLTSAERCLGDFVTVFS